MRRSRSTLDIRGLVDVLRHELRGGYVGGALVVGAVGDTPYLSGEGLGVGGEPFWVT